MAYLEDFAPLPPSSMVAAYAHGFEVEIHDLGVALQWRQLLQAFDSPYTFYRSRALAKAFRMLKSVPAPMSTDPFACLSLEGATGRDGSAPSIVSAALKRIFPVNAKPKVLQQQQQQQAAVSSPLSEHVSAMGHHRGTTPSSPGGPQAEGDIDAAVTYQSLTADASPQEKELCFRLCQGVCILSQSQRRLAEESRLVDVALQEIHATQRLGAAHFAEMVSSATKAATRAAVAARYQDPLAAGTESDTATPATFATSVSTPVVTFILAEPSANKGAPSGGAAAAATAATARAITSQRAEAVGNLLAPEYRVVLAALDALEAMCHFGPAAVYRLLKHNGVSTLMGLLSDPRQPRVVRAAVADVLATLLTEMANPLDWPDSSTAAAFETEVRNALRSVQQAQESCCDGGGGGGGADGSSGGAVASAAQLFESLRGLRDYEGSVVYHETLGGTVNATRGSSGAGIMSSPSSPMGPPMTAGGKIGYAVDGSTGIDGGMPSQRSSGRAGALPHRRLGALRKESGALLARRRKAREERFNTLMDRIALPVGVDMEPPSSTA